MATPSLLIAAPSSGSGKTTITLALLRAFKNRGTKISSFKVGPDYIDPAFHTLASTRECYNLDPWAMSKDTISRISHRISEESDLLIGEAVMGLFDGAQNGQGSSADLALILQTPIILVVDAKGQAASVGAVLHGFNTYQADVKIAGVIFNSVGSDTHAAMLNEAAKETGIPVIGHIPKTTALKLEHRHLGLIQAREKSDLESFLDTAAALIEENLDLEKLTALANPLQLSQPTQSAVSSPAQHIAVARDDAFAFSYPHLISDWRDAGAEISFFSPLNNEGPELAAGFIYLPGGYPELHAGKLSAADLFKSTLRSAAQKGVLIYGECGGYMTLGQSLTDASGVKHAMLDLLPVETSFEHPKLHLGYRNATLAADSFLGTKATLFKAHEFHYACVTSKGTSPALFSLTNAKFEDLGSTGHVSNNVAGSFIHLIDRATHD